MTEGDQSGPSLAVLFPRWLMGLLGLAAVTIVIAGLRGISELIGPVFLALVLTIAVQPKVVGDAVGLSATLSFLSLVFWAWVLGAVGALLAIPLSLFVKALFVDFDPSSRWLRPLIGDPDKPVEEMTG